MTDAAIAKLQAENDRLRMELKLFQHRLAEDDGDKGTLLCPSASPTHDQVNNNHSATDPATESLAIIVVGASGDLAIKKTFPALFSLYVQSLLPPEIVVAGYARSHLTDAGFKKKISTHFNSKVPNFEARKDKFLSACFYASGQYDSNEDFAKMVSQLEEHENKSVTGKIGARNRVFYFAIPPNIFVNTAQSIRATALSSKGFNRVIVEKPFGKDSESSAALNRSLLQLFPEDSIYRIDHYLGKEMVQNLMILRFSNTVFEPLWDRTHINCIQITFKEDFGTKGRGGYFDSFGIIRDVMQNHLLQILSLVAMETPISLSAEDVRDEKVKLLRCIQPLQRKDLVIGQYLAEKNGKECAYTEDPTVPKDSITPTFACAVLYINNARWSGVPFILKCGKALNERKADIRIQFKIPANRLFSDVSPNELVLRVQPDEAVYLKMTTKQPGLSGDVRHTELDLSYKKRFGEQAQSLPDAYERLIYDVARGDHNLFVRADELNAAWKIFTPILHQLEEQRIAPTLYEYGSRGPKESDDLIASVGYVRTEKYEWSEQPDTPSKL